MIGGSKENRARLISVLPSEYTGGNGPKLKQKILFKEKKTQYFLYSRGGTACSQGLWSIHPWRFQNPTGHDIEQPFVVDPALRKEFQLDGLWMSFPNSSIP